MVHPSIHRHCDLLLSIRLLSITAKCRVRNCLPLLEPGPNRVPQTLLHLCLSHLISKEDMSLQMHMVVVQQQLPSLISRVCLTAESTIVNTAAWATAKL